MNSYSSKLGQLNSRLINSLVYFIKNSGLFIFIWQNIIIRLGIRVLTMRGEKTKTPHKYIMEEVRKNSVVFNLNRQISINWYLKIFIPECFNYTQKYVDEQSIMNSYVSRTLFQQLQQSHGQFCFIYKAMPYYFMNISDNKLNHP